MRLASLFNPRLLIPILMAALLAQALPAGGQELVEVGSMPYGPCYAAALNSSRNVAFLGNGSVLQAVELSDPLGIVLVGELKLTGAVHDMFLGEGYGEFLGKDVLYVANGHGGLRVVTVEYTTGDAGAVTEAKFTEISSLVGSLTDARALAIVGGYAYVANGRHGLAVVDVNDQAQLQLLGSYDTPGEALDVACLPALGHVYVADGVGDGTSGLIIINASDPANLTKVDHTLLAVNISSVAVVGNWLYLLDRDASEDRAEPAGLCMVDMSDASNPVRHPYLDTDGEKVSLTVRDETVIVANGSKGFSIISASNPASLEKIQLGVDSSGLDKYYYDTPGYATSVVGTRETLLVADSNGGLRVVARAEGTDYGPYELGFYDTPGLAQAIAISGQVAYIADDDGLRAYDISSPLAFPELGLLPLDQDVRGLAASGNRAYFVESSVGLHLVDATKPAEMTKTSILAVPSAHKVAVINGVANVTCDGGDLHLIDVQDPTYPKRFSVKAAPGPGLGLAVNSDMTYVMGDSGLWALERKNLSSTEPYLIDITGLTGPSKVALSGKLAYVADGTGLRVLDVSTVVGSTPADVLRDLPSADSLTTVAVAGSEEYPEGEDTLRLAAYAVGDNALHVVDVTRSRSSSGKEDVTVTELDPITLPLDKQGDVLATSGNRVYVIAGAAGVRIYGVDRDAPVADAGSDISIFSGFTTYLKAEASTDDVAIVKYAWRSLNSNIEPSDADKAEARFIAPKVSQPTQYEFELTVEDKTGRSDTDTMVVTVKPYTGRGDSDGRSSGCTLNPEAGFRAEWLFLAGLMAVLRLRRRKR